MPPVRQSRHRTGALGVAAVLLLTLTGPVTAQTAGGGMHMGGGQMGGGHMRGGMMGWSTTDPGAAAGQGRRLFADNCAVCHRSDGRGGVKLGKVSSADLRAPGLETAYHGDDGLLARAILMGLDEDGSALDPAMPRWHGRLRMDQVAAIIAYLKQLES